MKTAIDTLNKFSLNKINIELDSLMILERLAQGNKSAVKECVDVYGSIIWALAKKMTGSPEEAEEVVLEVFKDVWQFAARFDSTEMSESDFIVLITYRRLIKRPKIFDEFIM